MVGYNVAQVTKTVLYKTTLTEFLNVTMCNDYALSDYKIRLTMSKVLAKIVQFQGPSASHHTIIEIIRCTVKLLIFTTLNFH